MKFKKTTALLAALIAVGALGGCGAEKDNGKIKLSVSNWPSDTDGESLAIQNKTRDGFMEANPDIDVIGDTYKYDTKTFTMKATANQLPTMYKTFFTEIKQIIKNGYAADITDAMQAHGYDTAMNPELLEFVTDENGRIFGVPTDAYKLGLYINKPLFREAGLVNADGTVKEPDTWEEVAEFSKIIREKTGKAGFVYPTTNNCGGWLFLNIAWSYGVEFENQREDGTWEATFDTPEAREALQYIKDLKWKYDALVADTVIDQDTMYKYFSTSQGAMMLRDVPYSGYGYGLPLEELHATKMPKGPAGRFSQMGGNLWMFSAAATSEEIEAGFKWLEYTGFTPEVTDERLEKYGNDLKQSIDSWHAAVLEEESFSVWTNPETIEKKKAVRKQYANVDYEDYKNYFEATDVTIKAEPPACAQQLYSVLDKCIQEVITNENADVDKLITEACVDFQKNHLDKM